ncbi:insulin-induced protein-domain-containing protein [Xylaria palmicola]|nr:insulin-induced protein-domain-containing protein [Xylaria palmicola]
MSDSPSGPPLLRPVPVRPFNINLKEPTPPGDESLPHTPQTGSSLNLDWLNFKLLNPRSRVRPESSETISRAQSVKNLTSSTLMGIYEPTTYDNDKYASGNDINTPWGVGAETPGRVLGTDEPIDDAAPRERPYQARRRSSAHHPIHIPPISTSASIFYSGLRALLLSGLGVLYGIGVSTVRGGRPAGAFRVEHVIGGSDYGWGYMAFWGASGLVLGCLLPWVDGVWERSLGDDGGGGGLAAVETGCDAGKNLRRRTDWALAVRVIGIFIGIAYAIRKLPWDSTLQVSLSLALVNPALWYLIDGSMPGFVVSSAVGLAGSALLTGLQPGMVPAPAMLSSSSSSQAGLYGTAAHANASARYADAQSSSMVLGGLASQQTLAMGIWTLNVLFCCCVVFGNVGRWLAVNKYGSAATRQGLNRSGLPGFAISLTSLLLPSRLRISLIPPTTASFRHHRINRTDNVTMSEPAHTVPPSSVASSLLDPTKNARRIVRLLQCERCNRILENPTTLPCGYSICMACLPPCRPPAYNQGQEGSRPRVFICPFRCGEVHAAADCSPDVILGKVLDIIAAPLSDPFIHITPAGQGAAAGLPTLQEGPPEASVLDGGRLVATLARARLGRLAYRSGMPPASVPPDDAQVDARIAKYFGQLKERALEELDCPICMHPLQSPMTTGCGHTYCRDCLYDCLDRETKCPVCRIKMNVRPWSNSCLEPLNRRLRDMMAGFWPDLVASACPPYGKSDIPILVSNVGFPSIPTVVDMLEPQHRSIVRRAMWYDRAVGLVAVRDVTGASQPHFGETGLLARIVGVHSDPHGCYSVKVEGTSRFWIEGVRSVDDHPIASVRHISDIDPTKERDSEADDCDRAARKIAQGAALSPSLILDSLSTQELFRRAVDFANTPEARSLAGPHALPPPRDPAPFTWWFAAAWNVGGAGDDYNLLRLTNVRNRLKVINRFIDARESITSTPDAESDLSVTTAPHTEEDLDE